MLTSRGWWFLTIIAFLIVMGALVVPYYSVVPVLLGLALLGWFAIEWGLFQARVQSAVTRLRVERRIVQGGRDVPMVWTGLAFEVHLRVRTGGRICIPFLVLEDRLPVIAERECGENEHAVLLAPDVSQDWHYTLRAAAPGILRFEGVRVRLADLQGFFYHTRFLRESTEYLVLPPLTDEEGRQRATKRFNTLPPPGGHRFRRPGTGSELLDLRDYQAGDPPKMIAWRPSARRDTLITKEFESDVPVRCVLFLDTSDGMRLGPPGNTPLTRMSAIASSIAQSAASNRDLFGLTTFDTDLAQSTNPARTKLHMIHVMRQLAEVAALQPGTVGVPPEELTRRTFPLAYELYPEAMAKKANRMPLGRLWIPLLDKWWGFIVLFAVLYPALMGIAVFNAPKWLWRPWIEGMAYAAEQITQTKGKTWINFLILSFLPVLLGGLFWLIYGIRGWFGTRAQQLTRRKRLSALFAVLDGSGPAGVERLIHDDDAYGERVGRFLQKHQLRCPVPLYDAQGKYRFRCAAKSHVLAGALVRSVGRARDNELFVILADLIELGEDLMPVVKAARVARSRHHQLLVIVPWPADVPPLEDAAHTPIRGQINKHDRRAGLMSVVQSSLIRQYHESFRKLRRSLGQVGAIVVRVNEGDPVQLVLDRLERLRGLRSRR